MKTSGRGSATKPFRVGPSWLGFAIGTISFVLSFAAGIGLTVLIVNALEGEPPATDAAAFGGGVSTLLSIGCGAIISFAVASVTAFCAIAYSVSWFSTRQTSFTTDSSEQITGGRS